MKQVRALLIFTFLFLIVTTARSGNILYVDGKKDVYSIYRITDIYIDQEKKLNIKELSGTKGEKLFVRNYTKDLNFGFSDDNLWLRFSIVNESEEDYQIILAVENPDINHLSFYRFEDGKQVDSVITGEREKFNSRKYYNRKYVFALKLKPHKLYTYYFKANNDGDVMFLPIHIEALNYFQVSDVNQNFFIGIIFGLFLFIILFNTFLLITINERIYLYYSLYVLFLALASFNIEGYSFQYLWPNTPKITDILTAFFLSLSVVFLFEFSRIFLRLKEWFPILNRICIIMGVIYGVIAVMSFLDLRG